MSHLNALLSDLRERKIWPLAVALLAALVAIPVVLAKHPAPTPVPAAPSVGTAVAATHTGAPVSVSTTPVQPGLPGKSRDPFTPQGSSLTQTPTTAATSTVPAAATAAVEASLSSQLASSSGGASLSSASTGGSSSGGSSVTVISSPEPSVPASTTPAKGTPAPAGLADDEAYDVALSVTGADGSLDTVDPLPRLSPVPSAAQPLLLELGVLHGGHRVMFVVRPGTAVSGPGECVPGSLDCELLVLSPGQTETVSTATGDVLFAVTGISTHRYASAAAARTARQAVSATGNQLLSGLSLKALPLFPYESNLGVVVDQRNLTVGGN
jgi:hypothetical protein